MLAIPSVLQSRFEEHLRNKTIPDHLQWPYKKWLRYYLDYCEKHHFSPIDKSSLPRFIGKLREKKQTEQQQGQAAEAIKMYYEILSQDDMPSKAPLPQPIHHGEENSSKDGKHVFIHESPAIAIQHKKSRTGALTWFRPVTQHPKVFNNPWRFRNIAHCAARCN